MGYLNRQFQPLTEFIYDAATPILDGFGAVKQGESWALIGDDLQMATDFVFSDVLQDEWGFCSRNGVAFVKMWRAVHSCGCRRKAAWK